MPATGGDPNFDFTTADLGSQYLRVNYQAQTTDITRPDSTASWTSKCKGDFSSAWRPAR